MKQRRVEGLSERLRECLLSCPLSPTEIEEQYGINHSHISRYTSDVMIPSVYTLSVLAKICGVTTDYLIYGKGA